MLCIYEFNLYKKTYFLFILFFLSDIETQIREIQEKKKQVAAETDKGVGLLESGYFDSELYEASNTKSKYEGYVTSIAPNEEEDDDEDEGIPLKRSVNAPAALLNDVAQVNIISMKYKIY